MMLTGRRPRIPVLALLLATLSWTLPGATATAGEPVEIARARELVDAGRWREAQELLDGLISRDRDDAESRLLRSTVLFVLGEVEAGRRDLDRALQLDPGMRQAWLNRAALDLSERRLDEALAALRRARDLDPEAADNSLNIGAVLVLQGKLPEASEHFQEYLARSGGSAEAYLLVASNFAMGGYAGLAVRHLQRAIQIDERTRLRARTDANFSDLGSDPEFRRLLSEDGFEPSPGMHVASRTFDAAYEGGRGRLLQAVMNTLQLSGRPFEPQVEVTPGWSLIWSDFRIKVRPETPTTGVVELSAPAERFSPAAWQHQSEAFFRDLTVQLVRLSRPR